MDTLTAPQPRAVLVADKAERQRVCCTLNDDLHRSIRNEKNIALMLGLQTNLAKTACRVQSNHFSAQDIFLCSTG